MPGALKLINLAILHAHKPYKLLSNLSSPTSAATLDPRAVPPLRSFSGWWCGIAPFEPLTHVNIQSHIFHRRKRCQNYCLYASDHRDKGENGHFDRNKNNNSGTQMGAIVNGKLDSEPNESDAFPPQSYTDKPPAKPSNLLTLPTILTIGRVAAVPFLVCSGVLETDMLISLSLAFYVENWWGPAATVGIFIAAATTDWLDGYLARKMKLSTPFGAFLDPVADKLMVASTLILLCTKPFEVGMFGQAPWLLTVPATAIICREITMSAIREWAASRDKKLLEAVAVNNLGKWKTATQMSALTILLAARDGSLVGAESLVSSGVVLLYVSAWLSLWSLVVYMRKIWRVLLL